MMKTLRKILLITAIYTPFSSDDLSHYELINASNTNTVFLQDNQKTFDNNIKDNDIIAQKIIQEENNNPPSTGIIDTQKINQKEIFHDVLINDAIYQPWYAIGDITKLESENIAQLINFFAASTAGTLYYTFTFDNNIISLFPKKYNVIPSYLSEDESILIKESSQQYISQYFENTNQNTKYINLLGVKNLKQISNEIINDYDATKSIDIMLLENQNFQSMVTAENISQEDKIKIHQSAVTYISDLLQIKNHARYNIAFLDFIKNYSTSSSDFKNAYNAFYKENISQHHLQNKDYTLMMQYFLSTISNDDQQAAKYLFAKDINQYLLDESFVKQSFENDFKSIQESIHETEQENNLIYNALIANNSQNFLRIILEKGFAIGKLARYGVIAIINYFLTAVGLISVGGNYVSNELIAKNFSKENYSIQSEISSLEKDGDDKSNITINKIEKINSDFKNSNEFKVFQNLLPSIVKGYHEDSLKLKNTRTLIAIKPEVMSKIVKQTTNTIHSRANLNQSIKEIKTNLDIPFLSKNYDTFTEKAKKLFNKYLDAILGFVLSNEIAFGYIDDEDKKNFVNNYINSTAKVLLTASYNNFYENFKNNYIENQETDFNSCFESYWDKNKDQYINYMYSQRFNMDAPIYDTFSQEENILKDECREYVINELLQEHQDLRKFYPDGKTKKEGELEFITLSPKQTYEIKSLHANIKLIPVNNI